VREVRGSLIYRAFCHIDCERVPPRHEGCAAWPCRAGGACRRPDGRIKATRVSAGDALAHRMRRAVLGLARAQAPKSRMLRKR
jgi:hypothetical protein